MRWFAPQIFLSCPHACVENATTSLDLRGWQGCQRSLWDGVQLRESRAKETSVRCVLSTPYHSKSPHPECRRSAYDATLRLTPAHFRAGRCRIKAILCQGRESAATGGHISLTLQIT